MHIEHFDDFLAIAKSQPQQERLLMVFARAELPDEANDQEKIAYFQGKGGALTPAQFSLGKQQA